MKKRSIATATLAITAAWLWFRSPTRPPQHEERATDPSAEVAKPAAPKPQWRQVRIPVGWGEEVQPLAPSLLDQIRAELTYASLDCPFVSNAPYSRKIQRPLAPGMLINGPWISVSIGDEILDTLNWARFVLVFGYVQKPFQQGHSLLLSSELGKLIHDPELTRETPEPLLSDWTPAIGKRIRENNVPELIGLINYLEELDMEWVDANGRYTDLLSLYMDQFENERGHTDRLVPRPSCIARNAAALQLLYMARAGLAYIIAQEPLRANDIMDALSPSQRPLLLQKCAVEFFRGERDPLSIEHFFVTLPEEVQQAFIAVAEYILWNKEAQSTAARLADETVDETLRDAAIRWKEEKKPRQEEGK